MFELSKLMAAFQYSGHAPNFQTMAQNWCRRVRELSTVDWCILCLRQRVSPIIIVFLPQFIKFEVDFKRKIEI